ncbi:flagellar hook-associated protein FlgK [Ferroacidibacillus organovorans]|uniref:Flagellar hook-associated protein 1 n=1 Tax=Ferroacidibacillus organovorans TaxID=1765683 RepID=A0A1V4EVF0_9BACL|nr:flagellar hook-associated protein FlgK [Ferroacidibacillus organovorans]OPG16906.1 flagellar hook-associated protein FlgK [Ferroacidibacillus organovorans]
MNISTFYALNVGMSALNSAQQTEDVIANNIANANTPGYVQETANATEATPFPPASTQVGLLIGGQMGQGSSITSVSRQINAFYNEQDRANQGTSAMYNAHQTILTQIEGILNEPSSMSVQTSLDQFFASWQTLSTDPSSTAARQSVITQGQGLAQTLQTITSQLETVQTNLQSQVTQEYTQFNQYATQVATLNNQILAVQKNLQSPNTLLDQRGAILDKMAKLANITITQSSNAFPSPSGTGTIPSEAVNVMIGSVTIVNSSTGTSTTTMINSPTTPASGQTPGSVNLLIGSGQIAGDSQGLTDTGNYLSQLSSIANQISSTFTNPGTTSSGTTITGYPINSGTPSPQFFTVTTDAFGNAILNVNSGITPNTVPASDAPPPGQTGNGNFASYLASQQNTSYTISYTIASPSGTSSSTSATGTLDQLISQMTSSLGNETANVQNNAQTAQALAQQSSTLRQSVSSVDINQQASLMVQYQNAYGAAAKYITVFNAMMQTLLGIVP